MVFRALCEEGILVRDVSRYPMLGQFLRVSVGLPRENDRFLEASESDHEVTVCGRSRVAASRRRRGINLL